MRTLLRYPGGKSRAYRLISNKIPKLPYPNKIISPFLGGGSMEARWAGEWNVPTYGFDIFGKGGFGPPFRDRSSKDLFYGEMPVNF